MCNGNENEKAVGIAEPGQDDMLTNTTEACQKKVELPGHAFTAVCMLLFLLHGFCGAFLIACARLYWYIEHPYLVYFVDLLVPEENRYFKFVGTSLGCLGALHLLQSLEQLRYAVIPRRRASVTPLRAAAIAPNEPNKFEKLYQQNRIVRHLFGPEGILTLNSKHYEWISMVMEVAQIVSQVFQAYRSSHLIDRVWINRCYVAIVDVESVQPDSFDFLDERTLTALLISHCPALVVPQSIQNFPNLLGIEIHNSTVVEWSKEASISASLHTKMVFLILSQINMTRLPDGILEPLPSMLQDIEITMTNLTSLPDDLHERWKSIGVLYLEFSHIQVFPETLFQLEVYNLSLIGNQLETVPEYMSAQPNCYVLALSHNPLRSLPSTIRDGLSFDFLALEYTKLEELPEWTDTSIGELMYLSGTPICEAAARGDGDTVGALQRAKATCGEEDPRGSGRYPIALMQPYRQP